MADYRWNTSDFAEGYDASAGAVHPHYDSIQEAILLLAPPLTADSRVIDLGGGSGRLVERILDRWPEAQAIVIDQSEPFLALAERRLARFGRRATCLKARLQDDWPASLERPATAIVSMSAIHHLEPAEKEALYGRCFDALLPGGVLLNGDEVRPEDDEAYLKELSSWANHMRRTIAIGNVPTAFQPALHGWIERNVTRFGEPKRSGDDCHETIAAQLGYLREAGFVLADCLWQHDLWAVLRGTKAR